MLNPSPSSRSARLASLRPLATTQAGMVRRQQLRDEGWTRSQIRHEVASGRWQVVAPEVIAMHNGPLATEQRRWLGVLHAGERAALTHRTACQVWD